MSNLVAVVPEGEHVALDIESLRVLHPERNCLTRHDDLEIGVDLQGVIQSINRVLPGYTIEQVVGSSIYQYLPLTQRRIVVDAFHRINTTGEPESYEVEGLGPEGARAWYSVRVSAREGKSGNTVVASDITKQRAAEERAKEYAKEVQALFDATDQVAFLMEPDGTLLAVNHEFCARVGRTEAQLVRTNCNDIVPRSIAESRQRYTDELVATGEVVRYEDERAGHHYVTTLFPVFDEMQQVSKIAVFSRDITRRKRMEEEKRSLEEQLHHSQKMEAIGRLAGCVAHDFNNLLCVIAGHAEFLEESVSGRDDRDSLQAIADAASSASALTKQLLAFSRKQVLSPQVIDLNTLVERMTSMVGKLLGEDIVLSTELQEQLDPVNVDPGKVEQILLNLVINARDAMPAGGELVIETELVELDDTYCAKHLDVEPGHYVMLAVSDTGCGMSKEVRERIFEPFFTTKAMGEGTGLGLATVFGIVKQNEGRIEAYSEQGVGSSFKVYFPRFQQNGPVEESPRKMENPTRGRETILVVEDEETVLDLVVSLLKRSGYRVLAADCGEEALDVAEHHEGAIDLLLTDVMMPRMKGNELAERISKLRPWIKVLFTSGFIGRQGALREDAYFLSKPFSPHTLTTKLRKILDS